ncbi:hypothetical protein ACHWQZ_G017622 [Mnemiopsis leidyi]
MYWDPQKPPRVPVDTTEDIVAVKLKAKFFDLDRDTFLINTYDSSANGSFKKRKQALEQDDHVTTLEHLQELLATIPISNDVILLGDFNARTGTLDDAMSAANQLDELELQDFPEKELNRHLHRDEEPFDIFDLLLFHKFFNGLYNRKCGNAHKATTRTDSIDSESSELLDKLNRDFTIEEINNATKKLHNNKSVSEDLISNEMLKNSGDQLKRLLVKLFNLCLQLNCAYGFKLGSLDIIPVNNYTYLGIHFSLNGSFKRAIDELRKKALRSFFSLRRIVDTRALTTKTMLKLIDSLVKPVAHTDALSGYLQPTSLKASYRWESTLPSAYQRQPPRMR